jgi:hypothetical protein
MKTKKIIKRSLLLLLLFALAYAVHYAWFAFPIISGYSAKNACSCAFIQVKTKEIINKEELGSFPLSLGGIDINYKDSSVTGTVLGMAKRKAIFRTGFGCTLVNEFSEASLRAEAFPLPVMEYSQESIEWPMGDQLAESQNTGINKAKLDSALAVVFEKEFNDKPVLSRAVLIVHKGQIVAERYASGYTKHSKFLGWSMAKSVTSAMVGILVKEGKLNVLAPAPVADWTALSDKRHKITLEHLLQQRSGIDFVEDYASFSDATNMLFNKGDMAGYVASLPLKYEPGTRFYYSSGNSNLLSGIIRNTVGEKQYHLFPYQSLFHKLGMYHTLLEPDASGTFVGSSYIYASARDYARFGLLYLSDGVWNGERILPGGWVQQTAKAPDVFKERDYGYQFWLNGFEDNDSLERAYPELPADMFMADGYGGQRIFIVPSEELVIVRLGLNKFDEHRFLRDVMDALKEK